MDKKIPKHGDLMTLDRFIECCGDGWFIDYDGFGYYSDGKMQSDITVIPSDIVNYNSHDGIVYSDKITIKEDKIRKEYSHVVWYNR